MGKDLFGAWYRSLGPSTVSQVIGRRLTSCKLPSPTNRTVRLSSFASLAARAAPSVAPTDHPIEPHRIWAM